MGGGERDLDTETDTGKGFGVLEGIQNIAKGKKEDINKRSRYQQKIQISTKDRDIEREVKLINIE